ncbi:MAG: gliding motility protein GldM [Bacteroidales bacterium]|nr:gliding motility protein GldM [Bacteroidales bacterium]
MSGVKETPRQKMIGMMYLVYTAMLALNVSAEILEAFKIVNSTTVETNSNFEKKLNDTYNAFEAQMVNDSASTVQYYQKAKQIRQLSDDLVNYLIDVRSTLIEKGCGQDEAFMTNGQVDQEKLRNVSLDSLKKIDDMSNCVNYLVPAEGKGEADVMIEKFAAYKSAFSSILDPKDVEAVKFGIDTDKEYYSKEKKVNVSWAQYYFGSSVLAADVVILNGFIQEVRNTEFEIISKLRSHIGATDFKFNAVEARVIPKKTNVFKGEEYEAEILVIAYDSMESPNVLYRMGAKEWNEGMEAGANQVQIQEAGKSILRIGTGGYSYGSQSYAGVIKIQTPAGDVKSYPFASEFFVQEASATISADQLNVFYQGLQNPITISVPGVPAEQISCNIKGAATIQKKGSGKWDVKPTAASGEVIIDAVVTENGKSRTMTSKSFRIKPLPKPSAYIAGKQDGEKVSKNAIVKNGTIEVKMPEDFIFGGINYTVKSFEVYYQKKGGYSDSKTVQGATIPSDILSLIEKMPTNSVLTIMNIKAIGPGGEQKANSLNISIY